MITEEFAAEVTRLGLEGIVRVDGHVSHQEALSRMAKAAVLLLLQASEDTRTLIPAKAFEYLRIGRPILALTPDGATADLLKEMDGCFVINPLDRVALRDGLLSLYRHWKDSPDTMTISRPILHYARSHLTSQLTQVLDELRRD